MSGLKRSVEFVLALFLALGAGGLCCGMARAETLEVHAVLATEPGKPGVVPAELAKFKDALGASGFSKFANQGAQTVNLSPAAPKASVPVGVFTLELARQGASKVDVTVKELSKNSKEGMKTVYGPLTYTFLKEKTKQLELPSAKGTLIVFVSLIKE